MSPKLKHLSGSEVVSIFGGFGFQPISHRGSEKQTLTIPLHNEIDTSTLRAIIRQATRYVPETELKRYFYSD